MFGALLAKTFWWKLLLCGALAYIGICALVYFGQRRLIYLPSPQQQPLPPGFVEWRSPDQTELWGFKRVNGARECLFFFHGNGGNASGWSHAVTEFPADIFVLEYPGYGRRPGIPSEKSLKQAALKAFEAEQQHYQKIVVAGQSLGTAITQAIFSKFPDRVHHLVLITPFTSIDDVARAHFPWLPTRWILRDKMRLFEDWQKFPGKSCIVLAGQDEVIPASHGRRYLEAKSDSCQIIEMPDESHNSIDLSRAFWEKVLGG